MVKLRGNYILVVPPKETFGEFREGIPSEGCLTSLIDNHEQLQSRRDRKLLQVAVLEHSDTNCSGLAVDRG